MEGTVVGTYAEKRYITEIEIAGNQTSLINGWCVPEGNGACVWNGRGTG